MLKNNKSAARAGASVARTAPSVDSLVVGNSAPALGTCSSADSAALGEGGAGCHLSGGACPPSLSSSSPSPDDEYSEVAEGESPCCSRSRYSSSRCSRRSCRRILRSFLRAAALAPATAPRTRAGVRGVGGLVRAAFTATLC
jgi:hypothetical protein